MDRSKSSNQGEVWIKGTFRPPSDEEVEVVLQTLARSAHEIKDWRARIAQALIAVQELDPVYRAARRLTEDALGDDVLWAATTPLRKALNG